MVFLVIYLCTNHPSIHDSSIHPLPWYNKTVWTFAHFFISRISLYRVHLHLRPNFATSVHRRTSLHGGSLNRGRGCTGICTSEFLWQGGSIRGTEESKVVFSDRSKVSNVSRRGEHLPWIYPRNEKNNLFLPRIDIRYPKSTLYLGMLQAIFRNFDLR